jgi:hypothetical protein
MKLVPIALFVYNRPWHTQETIESLLKNDLAEDSSLFIYSDAAKKSKDIDDVAKVRKYIQSIQGFNEINIIERDYNYGLAESVIDGVSSLINKYGKVIVLEDDLITSKYFLKYMNSTLEQYKDVNEVASVSGYMFPLEFNEKDFYFLPMISSWGWGTWKDSWDLFEKDGKKLLDRINSNQDKEAFNLDNTYPYYKMLKNQVSGKNNSWAIRWNASLFTHKKFSIWPAKSLIKNIGFDGSGTHCNMDYYNDEYTFSNETIIIKKKKVTLSIEAYSSIKGYLDKQGLSRLSMRRIMLKLISIFRK